MHFKVERTPMNPSDPMAPQNQNVPQADQPQVISPDTSMQGGTPQPQQEIPQMPQQPVPDMNTQMPQQQMPQTFAPSQQPMPQQQPMAPAAPQIPQPVGGMIPPQGVNGYGALKPKRTVKMPLLVGGAALALLILLAGGYVLYSTFMPSKYSASSLVSESGEGYAVSYPKKWKPLTSSDQIYKDAETEIKTAGITDLKVIAHKVTKDGKRAETLLLAASGASPVGDAELKEAIGIPEGRSAIEQEFGDSAAELAKGDEDCESVSNVSQKVEYNTSRFVVEVNITGDCTYKESVAKETGVERSHLHMIMGFKNSKMFLAALQTNSIDWEKNKDFYEKDMLPSFKPE